MEWRGEILLMDRATYNTLGHQICIEREMVLG